MSALPHFCNIHTLEVLYVRLFIVWSHLHYKWQMINNRNIIHANHLSWILNLWVFRLISIQLWHVGVVLKRWHYSYNVRTKQFETTPIYKTHGRCGKSSSKFILPTSKSNLICSHNSHTAGGHGLRKQRGLLMLNTASQTKPKTTTTTDAAQGGVPHSGFYHITG